MEYKETNVLVTLGKNICGIRTPTQAMNDAEIRATCRAIAEMAPDTAYDLDGKVVLGRMGIEAMLFIALTEFPDFYERYELAQFN